MKKYLLPLFIFFACGNIVAQQDTLSVPIIIGYIDMDSILSIAPERVKIDKHIQAVTTEYEKEFKRMQQEYNKKVKDFLKNNEELLDAIKLARQAEITEAEKRLATYKLQYKQQVKHEQDSLNTQLQNNIDNLIKQVAKEMKITVVLDKKNTRYLSPSCIDLFPFVEKKLLKK